MAACELIDFAASRRTQTKSAANIATALDEADTIERRVRAMIMQAHAGALIGVDVGDEIETARQELQRLAAQLAFADALAHRARKRSA